VFSNPIFPEVPPWFMGSARKLEDPTCLKTIPQLGELALQAQTLLAEMRRLGKVPV
jgi:hypothetical protein